MIEKLEKLVSKRPTSQEIITTLKDFVVINFGLMCYALGWAAFLLPYKITTGGLTGMCAIIYYKTEFPIQYSYFIANLGLLIWAFRELGFKYVLKTTYAIFALSFFLDFAQNLMTDSSGVPIQILGPGQDTMACILGAVLCGVCISTVFLSNGSTGGWDIVAAIINKHRNMSIGRVLLYLDILVIASCYFIFNDWRMVVFGYVTLVVVSYTTDLLINSTRQDIQFIIFSKDHVEISERIIKETSHSVTVIDSEGYYTHTPMKVMITIVHKNEAIQILRIIHEIDPTAFVSQSRVEGVYGNGFNKIKIK